MSIIEKKEELIKAIKNSTEYIDFINAKEDLNKYPEQYEYLDEYKKLLLESQLGQFLGDVVNSKTAEQIDEIYNEISKYEVINNYLNAEYRLKNVLHSIYQDLGHIIDSKEDKKSYFI
ncbi:MAG: YlbF family regulator [Firmicutes bacterium]|nr:YlbF family regulator [Bacillota bacterium]